MAHVTEAPVDADIEVEQVEERIERLAETGQLLILEEGMFQPVISFGKDEKELKITNFSFWTEYWKKTQSEP